MPQKDYVSYYSGYRDYRDSHLEGLESFWRRWFGPNSREVGRPYREFMEDNSRLPEWVYRNEAEKRPCWMSVNTYRERDALQGLEKLYFDFDSVEKPELAWLEVKDFTRMLDKFYGAKALVCFSGRKGFALYVFLDRVVGENLSPDLLSRLYKELMGMVLRGTSYETFDRAVVDYKRLSRIPYTIHQGSGSLCVPVDSDGSPIAMDAVDLGVFRDHGLRRNIIEAAGKLVKDQLIQESKPRPQRSTSYHVKYDGQTRPCIDATLQAGSIHTPPHKMMVATVAELHANGWGVDRIINAFSAMAGFDRRKTTYFVRHALKKGYAPFRCATIMGIGGCLRSECPIFRRRGGW